MLFISNALRGAVGNEINKFALYMRNVEVEYRGFGENNNRGGKGGERS